MGSGSILDGDRCGSGSSDGDRLAASDLLRTDRPQQIRRSRSPRSASSSDCTPSGSRSGRGPPTPPVAVRPPPGRAPERNADAGSRTGLRPRAARAVGAGSGSPRVFGRPLGGESRLSALISSGRSAIIHLLVVPFCCGGGREASKTSRPFLYSCERVYPPRSATPARSRAAVRRSSHAPESLAGKTYR